MVPAVNWSQRAAESRVYGDSILGGTNDGRGKEVFGLARRGGGPRTRLRRRHRSEWLAEVRDLRRCGVAPQGAPPASGS